MKKAAISIVLIMLLTVIVSCSGKTQNPLDEVANFFKPNSELTATVKSGSTTAKMDVEIFSSESDVVMRTVFSEPETLKGLVVERRKDGKLLAGYKGIQSELDQNALKFIAITHDILREVSNNLGNFGVIKDSGDERFGKATISVNEGDISVYYDIETKKPLRIDSDLFDASLKIDISKISSNAEMLNNSVPQESEVNGESSGDVSDAMNESETENSNES